MIFRALALLGHMENLTLGQFHIKFLIYYYFIVLNHYKILFVFDILNTHTRNTNTLVCLFEIHHI